MPGLFTHILDGISNWNLSRKVKSNQVVELAPGSGPDARYEAAYWYWTKRSYLPSSNQDARLDLTPGVRRELLKQGRYWEQNNPYVQRLLDLFEGFTVGANGLHLVPNSSDEAWNEAAAAWWRNFCQQPARDNFQPLGQLQSLIARSWFVDGDIFINKTFDPDLKRPAIQLIEAHRVETPGELGMYEGNGIVDGVETDEAGKPTAYYVRQRDSNSFYGQNSLMAGSMQMGNYSTPGAYARVAADNIIHIFEPPRAGLTRGACMLYPVERDLHDLDDLQDLEMQKAKENARTAKVIKTKTGEAPSTVDKYRTKYQINSLDANNNPVTKFAPQYYEITQGGDVVYMLPNEEMQEFRSESPTAQSQDFWNTLIGKVSIGVGIPRVLVVPYNMQGTVLRADIESAAAYFRARSSVVACSMQKLYVWAMGWAVNYDRSLKGAPKDWADVVIRPPRGINVDIGRQSQVVINEMNAGIRTMADTCNELGTDWREVIRQRAKEAKFINDTAAKYGVPREQIAEPPKVSAVQPVDDEEDEEEQEETKPDKNGQTNGLKLNGFNHHKRQELVP